MFRATSLAALLLIAFAATAHAQDCWAIETDLKVIHDTVICGAFVPYEQRAGVRNLQIQGPNGILARLLTAVLLLFDLFATQYNIPQGVHGTNGGCFKGERRWLVIAAECW
jgi:hypothetical protein